MRYLISIQCRLSSFGKTIRKFSWSGSFPTISEALEVHAKEVDGFLSDFPRANAPGHVFCLTSFTIERLAEPKDFPFPIVKEDAVVHQSHESVRCKQKRKKDSSRPV